MHAIEIGGDRYIKATDAAALTGYTTDYIGQLSRGKKISAERVGRAWYVSEREILGHKKGIKRSNKQKTQKALKQEMQMHGQIHHVYFDPTQEGVMPEYRKRLLAAEVRYEGDQSPLQPTPEKKSRSSEISREENIQKVETKEELASQKEAPELLEVGAGESFDATEPDKEMLVDTLETSSAEPVIAATSTDFDDHSEVAVRVRSEHRVSKPKKISHIPLEKTAPVPYGKPSYALVPIARLTVSVVLAVSFIASLGGVFIEKVMVYQQGDKALSRPYYETSYGVRAVSAVIQSLPK